MRSQYSTATITFLNQAFHWHGEITDDQTIQIAVATAVAPESLYVTWRMVLAIALQTRVLSIHLPSSLQFLVNEESFPLSTAHIFNI